MFSARSVLVASLFLAAPLAGCGRPAAMASSALEGGQFSLHFETQESEGCGQNGVGSIDRGMLWLALEVDGGAVLQLDEVHRSGGHSTDATGMHHASDWATDGERKQRTWAGEHGRAPDGSIVVRFEAVQSKQRCYPLAPDSSALCDPADKGELELSCRSAAIEVELKTPIGRGPIKQTSYEGAALVCAIRGPAPSSLDGLTVEAGLVFPMDSDVHYSYSRHNRRVLSQGFHRVDR
jgi:hypothetical protein